MKNFFKNLKIITAMILAVMVFNSTAITLHAEEPTIPTIYVAGVMVTDSNKTDILGNGTASLSYNESTGRWVLLLNNANIDINDSVIRANTNPINLEISLAGSNIINSETFYESISLGSKSNLYITGSGSLELSNADGNAIYTVGGVLDGTRYGNVTISDVPNLKISSNKAMAIACGGTLTIQNSTVIASNNSEANTPVVTDSFSITNSNVDVNATALYSEGIRSQSTGGEISQIIGSTVTVRSHSTAISSSSDIVISNSTIDAISESANAIYTPNSIIISDDSNVTVEGYYCGLHAKGLSGITIKNSKINAKSTGDSAIFTKGPLAISEYSEVVSDGYICGILTNGDISISDSTVTSKSSTDYGIWSKANLSIINDSKITSSGLTGSIGAFGTTSVAPTTGKVVKVLTGNDENSAMSVENSPFSEITDLTDYGNEKYFRCELYTQPEITKGGEFEHKVDGGSDVTIVSSGSFDDFLNLYINNQKVDPINYTAVSGSTVITLKASFLNTLPKGIHTLKFEYKDNVTVETTFTISEKPNIPDSNHDSWDDGGPFTTNECGTIYDRWGNILYEAVGCNPISSNYKVPNTGVE